MRLTQNHHLAEEFTQDTFVKSYRALPKFQGHIGIKAWLFTIARNTYFSWLRKNKPKLLEQPERIADKVDVTVIVEEQITVEACLAKMPLFRRELLLLRDLYGMSYKEICNVANLSEGQVKMGLHYARKQFRQLYNRHGGKGEIQ